MRKKNEKKNQGWIVLGLWVLAAVLTVAAVLVRQEPPAGPAGRPVQTTPPAHGNPASGTSPQETLPPVTEPPAMDLGSGLEIIDSGKYTGLYMEDGSNELLSDVMMIIVYNNGEQDIQLAEISAEADGETYRFQLTNLAVGERAVLLDLDRKSSGELTAAALEKAAFFDEPMDLYEDTIKVSGMDGMVNVQNISDEDISGDIYVYYKYAGEDIYYGGITFRVRVEGGLKAGEIRQIPAGHYNAEGCAVVQVTVHG